MIPFDEAYQIVMTHALELGTESVPMAQCLGRILAEDMVSDIDMPPFNKAAMDGYACRREDLKNELEILEDIPAGSIPQKAIAANQGSKIMTGAMVPEGADCVIMIEHTEKVSPRTIRFLRDDTAGNICFKGEDIQTGDAVLKKGAQIKPQHIAVFASTGTLHPRVSKHPRIGIVSTGSELVEPLQKPVGPQIRNSNGEQLVAQLAAMGLPSIHYGIADDTEEAIGAVIKKAMAETDVLLLSGGVSMGDFDLVPGVLKANGIEILFDRVAIQPGKPSTFGISENFRCFGLPGNPVSTFIQFEMLVKPFLFSMMGHDYYPITIEATTDAEISRRNTARTSILPVRFTSPGTIEAVDYHGSAHLNAMCHTDGFVLIPQNQRTIEKGARTHVRLL